MRNISGEILQRLEIVSQLRSQYANFFVTLLEIENRGVHELLYTRYTRNIPELIVWLFEGLNIANPMHHDDNKAIYSINYTIELLQDHTFAENLNKNYLRLNDCKTINFILQKLWTYSAECETLMVLIENQT